MCRHFFVLDKPYKKGLVGKICVHCHREIIGKFQF